MLSSWKLPFFIQFWFLCLQAVLCLLRIFLISKREGSSYFKSGELRSVKIVWHMPWEPSGNEDSQIYVLTPRCVSVDQEWPRQFSSSWRLMARYSENISGRPWLFTWLMSVGTTTLLVSLTVIASGPLQDDPVDPEVSLASILDIVCDLDYSTQLLRR